LVNLGCVWRHHRGMCCCRLVWRFAIRAVLQDLGKHRRWLSLPDLAKRRQQRLKYQQLYLQRLEKQSTGKEAPEVSSAFICHRSMLCSAYQCSLQSVAYSPYQSIVSTWYLQQPLSFTALHIGRRQSTISHLHRIFT